MDGAQREMWRTELIEANARLRKELDAWRDRFRAIIGEEEPDRAGNRVISLQQRVQELYDKLTSCRRDLEDKEYQRNRAATAVVLAQEVMANQTDKIVALQTKTEVK